MNFSLALTNDQGIAVAHHQVESAALNADADSIDIYLRSWGTEAARIDGAAFAARWFVRASLASLDLSGGFLSAVQQAVLASATFAGATLLPDSRSDLAAAKVRKWAEIKSIRDSRWAAGFVWGGATFDSDAESVSRIVSAAVSARRAVLNNLPFNRSWTLANNTEWALNATEMQAVAEALDVHLDAIHSIGVTLRAQIAAAASIDALAAIVWPG